MVLKRFENRPYRCPATLVQRFGAVILDIGMMLSVILLAVVIYHLALDVPFTRPRYQPPSPDMGWTRILRSAQFFGIVFLIAAAFTASPLRASPGMLWFSYPGRPQP